jgi:hypothetical protein
MCKVLGSIPSIENKKNENAQCVPGKDAKQIKMKRQATLYWKILTIHLIAKAS